MEGALEKKVAGVEEKMEVVLKGIGDIMTELGGKGRQIANDVGVLPSDDTRPMPFERVHVAPSTSTESQRRVNHNNVANPGADKANPAKADQTSMPQTDEAHGTLSNHPIVVEVDGSSSSSSGKNKKPTEGSPNKLILLAASVHANPRLRVVPFVGRLAVARQSMPLGHACKATGSGAPKYRDPPGYGNDRDFGSTTEPECKALQIEPKKKKVRSCRPAP